MAVAPTVEEIVDDLKEHVWQLICAGEVDAAMVLLAHRVEDFLTAFYAERKSRELVELGVVEGGVRQAGGSGEILEGIVVDVPTMILPRQLLVPAEGL